MGRKTRPAPDAGASGFAARVIDWQRVHGRHDLPWQETRDPYRVWVSEIMLQQTQVAAVIGYYSRFLARFSDVAALARAPESEVMRLWSGLGYYSRARNLHRAARMVMEEFGGGFPREAEAIATLPGVGRSTAAAIATFSFGARAAILDGNVKRVLARAFGIEGFPGTSAVEQRMWTLAEDLLPAGDVEAYTQGLMDLGATVCTRGRPRCEACPLAADCVARRDGRTAELPAARPRKARPRRSCVMLVLIGEGKVLLETRPSPGIWGGLLCLPQADDMQAAREMAHAHGGNWESHRMLPPIAHGFTHFELEIQPVMLEAVDVRPVAAREPGATWLALAETRDAALPAPVKRLLTGLADSPQFSPGASPARRDSAG